MLQIDIGHNGGYDSLINRLLQHGFGGYDSLINRLLQSTSSTWLLRLDPPTHGQDQKFPSQKAQLIRHILVIVGFLLASGYQQQRQILMKDPKDKCDFWEWVDDDEEIITKNENKKDEEHDFNTEVKIAILEHDFSEYKMKTDKECKSFRKELDKRKCLVLMFVVLFVVKYMI
ncbi:unnamed protein product [Lactuca saligna]|uniref:Uncharacterized protein n=1 Tax=Lactuca saligna TaxID=75948 RepID=A0AA35ZYV4_LACSI|nr:unnamed protein product [Lactuca saligna]